MTIRRQGFIKFSCKAEGKNFEDVLKEKFSLRLEPSNFSLPTRFNHANLAELVYEILAVGPGGEIEIESQTVDTAFLWHDHTSPRLWEELYDTGYVTDEVYNICDHWNEELTRLNSQTSPSF